MNILSWLRGRRIQALEVDLAAVEAEIASDTQVTLLTGKVFPMVAGVNARERARILKTLEHLRSDRR